MAGKSVLKKAIDKQYQFNLKVENSEILGRSELYS
jgi:uncharacterized protein YegP (UPF0339 family)